MRSNFLVPKTLNSLTIYEKRISMFLTESALKNSKKLKRLIQFLLAWSRVVKSTLILLIIESKNIITLQLLTTEFPDLNLDLQRVHQSKVLVIGEVTKEELLLHIMKEMTNLDPWVCSLLLHVEQFWGVSRTRRQIIILTPLSRNC